jgi:hypothetical protein
VACCRPGSAIAILGTRHKSVGGSAAPLSLAALLASSPQAAEQQTSRTLCDHVASLACY